ncbi:hypothetical protein A6769_33850 [Nostoc punctiforme NIES-2108]|uniref:Peroxidase n=1 Tax=Nostoc punctiforme NIES-2108 TaxID=1356359 RepID=A0A367R1H5_NOSPU|nr:hypothetical protein A6769_33850 [Nostoc punctiforme NIES-2108]
MSNPDNNLEQYEKLINNSEPINIDDPAYEQILKDLQGGIIKSYGRNYSLYIFIQFDNEKAKDVKQWIQDQAKNITSTSKQLKHTETYKKMRQQDPSFSGELCKNFFLSYQGYKTLGFDPTNPKPDDQGNKKSKLDDSDFKGGMKCDWETTYRPTDNTPTDYWYNPPENWDIGKVHIDALILLAHNCLEYLKKEANSIIDKCEEFGKVVACEAGYILKDSNDKTKSLSIGPFGFADSISQPLFLKKDYDNYCKNQNIEQWDPKASLNLVLAKDPFGEPYSYGSYCVWQKLETCLERFEQKVGELANCLKSDRERASALVIGRFKDGTPLDLSDLPNQNDGSSIANSFNYADDFHGSKCPIQAHIRKVNPRKDKTEQNKDQTEVEESRRTNSRIVRAGRIYFDNSNALQTSNMSQLCLNKLDYLNEVSKQSLEKNIASISGLLFVCFQKSIHGQFQKLQQDWADDRNFPKNQDSIYLDPVIGHPVTKRLLDPLKEQKWPPKWNSGDSEDDFTPYLFYNCVRNKGGEFFFAPSISFLENIAIDCIKSLQN